MRIRHELCQLDVSLYQAGQIVLRILHGRIARLNLAEVGKIARRCRGSCLSRAGEALKAHDGTSRPEGFAEPE